MKGFTKFLFGKDTIGFLTFGLVLLLTFGYPLSAAIAAHLGILEATMFNAAFRAIYLALALYLIAASTLHRKSLNSTMIGYVFMIFLFVYCCRFFYDTQIGNLKYAGLSTTFLYAYSIGNTFLPAIAIFLTAKYCKYEKYTNYIFWFLLLINLLMIGYVVRSFGLNLEIFFARNALDVDPDDKSRGVMGPITYSYTGEVLAIFSLFRLLIDIKGVKKINRLLLLLGLGLGALNLVLGASRSPFIAYIVVTILTLFYYFRNSRKTQIFYSSIITKFVMGVALIAILANTLLKDFNFTIFERLALTVQKQISGEGEHRNWQWKMAWDNFIEHPLIGDAFVVRQIRHDAHNVFLEVFMAVGIYGALFFYIAYIGFLIKFYLSYLNNHSSYALLSMLMVASSFAMLTSGNIFTGYKWMILFVFLLCVPTKVRTNIH